MAYDRHGHHHLVWSEANKVFYLKDLVGETDSKGTLLNVFDTHRRRPITQTVKSLIQYDALEGQCPCDDCWCPDAYPLSMEPDPQQGGAPRGPFVDWWEEPFVYAPSLHVNQDTVSIIAHQTKRWDPVPVPNPIWDQMYRDPIYDQNPLERLYPTRFAVGWRAVWKTSYEEGDEALYEALGFQAQYRYRGTWYEDDTVLVAQRPLLAKAQSAAAQVETPQTWSPSVWQNSTESRWRVSVVDNDFGQHALDQISYPALTTLASGRMVSAYEKGSLPNSDDPSESVLALRFSDDGGQTWLAPTTPTTLQGTKPLLSVVDRGHGHDGQEVILLYHAPEPKTDNRKTPRKGWVYVARSRDGVHYSEDALGPAQMSRTHEDRLPRGASLAVHESFVLAAWVSPPMATEDENRIVTSRASYATEQTGVAVRLGSELTRGTSVPVQIHAVNDYHMRVSETTGGFVLGSHADTHPTEDALRQSRPELHTLALEFSQGAAAASVPVEWLTHLEAVGDLPGGESPLASTKVRIFHDNAQGNLEKALALRGRLTKTIEVDGILQVVEREYEFDRSGADIEALFGAQHTTGDVLEAVEYEGGFNRSGAESGAVFDAQHSAPEALFQAIL